MVSKPKRMIGGHYQNCGIVWDWPCDCGVLDERRKLWEDLTEPLRRLSSWLSRRLG